MSQTTTQAVASTIRAEVARRNLRQAELAELLGLTQQAISRRLQGRTPFTVSELHTLSRHLEVPLDALFGEVPA